MDITLLNSLDDKNWRREAISSMDDLQKYRKKAFLGVVLNN